MADATDDTARAYAARLDVDYPEHLDRLTTFFRILWAIPIVIVLGLIAVLLTIVAWFAILVTGRYPRPLFDFVVGVGRWATRVWAYAFLLVTDDYPPFTLR